MFTVTASNNLRDVISKNSYEQVTLLKHVFSSFRICKERNTLCSLFIKNSKFDSEQSIIKYVKDVYNEINTNVTISGLNDINEMTSKTVQLQNLPFILRKPIFYMLNFDEFKALKTMKEKKEFFDYFNDISDYVLKIFE